MNVSSISKLHNCPEVEELEYQLPEESPFTIKINDEELVTLMCTRTQLTYLVVGFLYLQRVINSLSDLAYIQVCDEDLMAEVRTTVPYDIKLFHKNKAITSGCTGGVMMLNDTLQPIDPNIKTVLSAFKISEFFKVLYKGAEGYRATGGIHSSAITLDGKQIQYQAEDIGRHNTIDKLAGICTIRGVMCKGGVIITTGRISSEMVAKALRMEVPILISRTSPTSLAAKLAEEMGITLVGYARAGKYKVYTNPWRIKNSNG